MTTHSKSAMSSFLEMMTTKGWVNLNTGNAYKSAVNKILNDVPSETDVREIDVRSEVLRYNNLNPGELTPESLRKYEQRVGTAIQQFLAWKENPTGYRAPSRAQVGNGKTPEVRKRERPTVAAVSKETSTDQAKAAPPPDMPKTVQGVVTESSLAMPFPLRSNFLAQVVIPRDLTKEEAARLCAFIQALAQQ